MIPNINSLKNTIHFSPNSSLYCEKNAERKNMASCCLFSFEAIHQNLPEKKKQLNICSRPSERNLWSKIICDPQWRKKFFGVIIFLSHQHECLQRTTIIWLQFSFYFYSSIFYVFNFSGWLMTSRWCKNLLW